MPVEAKPGKEAEVEQGLHGTLLAVQKLLATTAWFAWRLGPSTFGTVDLFLDEVGRETHRLARAERIQSIASQLFIEGSIAIDEVEVLLSRLPPNDQSRQRNLAAAHCVCQGMTVR